MTGGPEERDEGLKAMLEEFGLKKPETLNGASCQHLCNPEKLEVVIAMLAEQNKAQALLAQNMRHVKRHLRTLNGSVAKHEAQIGKLLIEQAKRMEFSRVITSLAPLYWAAAAAVGFLFLRYGPEVLKVIKP